MYVLPSAKETVEPTPGRFRYHRWEALLCRLHDARLLETMRILCDSEESADTRAGSKASTQFGVPPRVLRQSYKELHPLCRKIPGVQIQLNHHVCSGCRRELPENHWARTTMKMHLSYRKTPLICRECTAKGCTARDGNLYDCQACAQKLGCTHFDRHDLINRERPDRHKEGLICGCDTNSCSTMTTLKLVTLFFHPTMGWNDLSCVETAALLPVEPSA